MSLSLLCRSALSFTIVSFCFAIISGTKAAQAATLTVIADKLDNVRGLNFGADGTLYVTEGGVGGNGRCVTGPSLEGLPSCVGTTGAVTRIKDGKQERILTGLPSIALSPTGDVGTGPQDIQFDSAGNPYLLIGYAGNPKSSDFPANSPGWGQLYKADFNTGSLTSIADFGKHELANNPDGIDVFDVGGEIASNAYAFTIKGDTAYVVDAAANDLLSVGLDGGNLKAVSVLPLLAVENPVFPPADAPPPGQIADKIEVQSVPTGVTIGPDGAFYISEFTGLPFPVGEARIFRVGANGETTIFADGFTQLTDLEFDKEGNLYALQYGNQPQWQGNSDGSVIQIAPNGTRAIIYSGEGLEAPTALTVGPDGAVYVANKGDRAGVGQVVRIDKKQVAEPTSVLGLLFGSLAIASLVKRKTLSIN